MADVAAAAAAVDVPLNGLEQSSPAVGAERDRTFAERPRIESLTGVRWFAALAVFFSHFPLPGAPSWVETIFSNGYMGVTVFFVLSGFILTVNYGAALSRPSFSAVWGFAVARVARVYPTYILVLCYVLLLTQVRGGNLHHWILHVFALQAWSGNVYTAFGFNAPGWSIGVEFFLYACFPVLILVLSPILKRSRIDCLILAATVAVLMSLAVVFFHAQGFDALPISDPSSAHRWLYLMPVTRLGDFLLGICGGYLFLAQRDRPPRVWVTIGCEIALILVIVGMMSQKSLYFSAGSYDVIYAVPAAILLWFLAVQPHVGVGRLLSTPLLVALGEASYAFYLIHMPIKDELTGFAAAGGTLNNLLLDCLQLGLITALAWGIHVGFERPARRRVRSALSPSWRRTTVGVGDGRSATRWARPLRVR